MYHCQHVSVEIHLRKHTEAQRRNSGSVKCAIPYVLDRGGRHWWKKETIGSRRFPHNHHRRE